MGVVMARRIGVFGGTFDPIHVGHLVVAENCWFQLQLETVLFVPAGNPSHKRWRAVSASADRVAMVELAIAGNPHFRLSYVDVDRAEPTYSVDTLRLLRDQLGASADLFFIIGGDSLIDLPSWRDPDQLIDLCQIVAVNRPGYPPFDLERLDAQIPGASSRIQEIVIPDLDIAASELRRRVLLGEPIRYLVPDAVEHYIRKHGLYRTADSHAVRQ